MTPSRESSRANPVAPLHAMAPSVPPPARSSTRGNPTVSLHAIPPIRSARSQFPGVVKHAGSGSWDLRAAGGGSSRASSRPGRAPSVRSARRVRVRPLVRVEDRIEWVRRDPGIRQDRQSTQRSGSGGNLIKEEVRVFII